MHQFVPFRIRIGVSGHRELPDVKSLHEKLDVVFEQRLHELFDEPHDFFQPLTNSASKTRIRYTILTPLAEGADRLVAMHFLGYGDTRLEVVLPMAKEEYMQDFTTATSQKEFASLLRLDPAPKSLRAESLFANLPQEMAETKRRQAYLAAGKYVVEHCDVLVAIWDGKKARGAGGTTEIINYARRRRCPLVVVFIDQRRTRIFKGDGLRMQMLQRLER